MAIALSCLTAARGGPNRSSALRSLNSVGPLVRVGRSAQYNQGGQGGGVAPSGGYGAAASGACRTEYKQECQTVNEQECNTVQEQQCRTVQKQSCNTVNEQKCSQVNEQQCSTVNEQQCNTVQKQECNTVNEQVGISDSLDFIDRPTGTDLCVALFVYFLTVLNERQQSHISILAQHWSQYMIV